MKKISEKEKLRILNLHESMPMKPWLIMEKVPDSNPLYNQIRSKSQSGLVGSTYGGQSTKPVQQPTKLTQKQVSDIKSFVSSEAIREVPSLPFQNNAEANKFREWVNNKIPYVARTYGLAIAGKSPESYKDELLSKVWNHEYTYGSSAPTDDSPGSKGKTKKIGEWYLFDLSMDKKIPEFYKRLLPILEQAKTWWINWLNDKDTRIRFKKLNNNKSTQLSV